VRERGGCAAGRVVVLGRDKVVKKPSDSEYQESLPDLIGLGCLAALVLAGPATCSWQIHHWWSTGGDWVGMGLLDWLRRHGGSVPDPNTLPLLGEWILNAHVGFWAVPFFYAIGWLASLFNERSSR
jgi:hypothetical protein